MTMNLTSLSQQSFKQEELVAQAIHSHFHLNASYSQNDCINVTKLIAHYLLSLGKNISSLAINSKHSIDVERTVSVESEYQLFYSNK
jgi:hypothetical protein